jgi:hypothetical protein
MAANGLMINRMMWERDGVCSLSQLMFLNFFHRFCAFEEAPLRDYRG